MCRVNGARSSAPVGVTGTLDVVLVRLSPGEQRAQAAPPPRSGALYPQFETVLASVGDEAFREGTRLDVGENRLHVRLDRRVDDTWGRRRTRYSAVSETDQAAWPCRPPTSGRRSASVRAPRSRPISGPVARLDEGLEAVHDEWPRFRRRVPTAHRTGRSRFLPLRWSTRCWCGSRRWLSRTRATSQALPGRVTCLTAMMSGMPAGDELAAHRVAGGPSERSG